MITLNRKMNVMVIHAIDQFAQSRPTTLRNLWALEKYCDGARFYYHYFEDAISDALRSIPFDVVILDTTFLCMRWARPRSFFDGVKAKYSWLAASNAIILAFPQDDYDHAHILDDWLAEYGVTKVYSACPKYGDILYPRMWKAGRVRHILTGYIDDDDISTYASLQKPFEARSRDVGYRVRRLPPNFGTFGLLKSEFGRVFSRRASSRYIVDISDDPMDTIVGEDWPAFLGDCRFALGCESGSSILDARGEIRDAVEAAIALDPSAPAEQIIQANSSIETASQEFSVPSPRLFEIAMAGCCPILLEGDYLGLIRPEEHYIPVRRDFSNIDAAIARMDDVGTAKAIAARYRDAILENESLRYKNWTKTVYDEITLEMLGGREIGLLANWEFHAAIETHRSLLRAEYRKFHLPQVESYKAELRRLQQAANNSLYGRCRSFVRGLVTSIQ
jgi:hypothetical protein